MEITVFENRVLRRMYGPKGKEVTGGWEGLRNEELHNLYASKNIIGMIKSRRIRWAGHVTRMVEIRKAYNILVGKPEGKRPLEIPRSRWVDYIRLELREIRWEGVDWMQLAQDSDQWWAVVNTVMNFRVP